MPYVSPATAVTGPLTDTLLNSYKAAADYLSNQDRWQVTTVDATTNNLATSGTAQVIAWELDTYDAFGLHPPAGATDNRINIAQPGLYEVTACLSYATNATNARDVWISKGPTGTTPSNSTTFAQAVNRAAAFTSFATPVLIERELQCAAGDVLWVVGSQNSGGALALGTSAWQNFFSGRWVAIS